MPILTLAQTATNIGSTASTNIAHVNTLKTSGSGTSIPIAYTFGAIGNLIVAIFTRSEALTSIASAKTGAWTQWATSGVSRTPQGPEVWMAQITATGSGSITFTFPHTDTPKIFINEFTCTDLLAATNWLIDSQSITSFVGTGNVPWPTLSPNNDGKKRIYLGSILTDTTANFTATAGFTQDVQAAGFGDLFNAWDDSVLAPVAPSPLVPTNPAALDTATICALLIGAYSQPSTLTTPLITISQVPTGKVWIISQIGFEILPAPTGSVPVTVTFNGRTLWGNLDGNGGYVQGPPYITLFSPDQLTVAGPSVELGSTLIANFFYNEYPVNQVPNASDTV